MSDLSNIFENDYFTKLYNTRSESKAIFLKDSYNNYYILIVGEKKGYCITCDGVCKDFALDSSFDIISDCTYELNEEELKKEAKENNPYEFYGYYETSSSDKLHDIYNEGYIAGYHNAFNKLTK